MNTGVSIENSGFVKALAGATNTATGDMINSILARYRYSTDNADLLEQTDSFPAMVKDKLPGIAWKGGDIR